MSAKIKMKRVLWPIFASIFLLLISAVIVVGTVWYNEIATISSMRLVYDRNDAHKDGAVYTMRVKGSYYFDEFLQQGGASNDRDLLDFITSHITKGIGDVSIKESNINCSSFTAKTSAGQKLFARNYDFSKTNTCIVFTSKTKKRHATVSTVDLQFLGVDINKNVNDFFTKVYCLGAPFVPLDGMNDAGVSCGIYMTLQGPDHGRVIATDQNTDKPDITSTTLLRLILDYADDVDEAVTLAESYDLHDSANTSYHYMIADASGRSAILEWISGTDDTDIDGSKRVLHVTYNDNDSHVGQREGESEYQVVTNFIINPGYYDGLPVACKRGFDRYNNIYDDLIAVNGVVEDENEAMSILSHVGRRDWDINVPPADKSITVHSVVYNLTDLSMLWVPNEHYGDSKYAFVYKMK